VTVCIRAGDDPTGGAGRTETGVHVAGGRDKGLVGSFPEHIQARSVGQLFLKNNLCAESGAMGKVLEGGGFLKKVVNGLLDGMGGVVSVVDVSCES